MLEHARAADMNLEEDQLSFRFDIPLALVSPAELYQNAQAYLELLKEDRRFERKSARTSPRSLGEYFSMWANTLPEGGLIAIGIEDKGAVQGCRSLSQAELNEREQAGRVYCPDARFSSKLVPVINEDGESDFILLIKVDYRQDKVVYDSQGNAWVRIGDQKHELSKEQCRELEIDKGQVDFEQEPLINYFYPEEFDIERVAQFAAAFRKSRGLSYEKSDEQILELRHLGKSKSGRFILTLHVFCSLRKIRWNAFPDVALECVALRESGSKQALTTTRSRNIGSKETFRT